MINIDITVSRNILKKTRHVYFVDESFEFSMLTYIKMYTNVSSQMINEPFSYEYKNLLCNISVWNKEKTASVPYIIISLRYHIHFSAIQ